MPGQTETMKRQVRANMVDRRGLPGDGPGQTTRGYTDRRLLASKLVTQARDKALDHGDVAEVEPRSY